MSRLRRVIASVVCVLAVASLDLGVAVASAPPPSPPPALTIDEPAVRAAKAGLLWFLEANVDRPRNVADPCPLLTQASVGNYIGQLGLTSSTRIYGVELTFDTSVGSGILSVRCGVDVAASAEPAGSTAAAVDVFMLDGQATFGQYVVRTFGRDVVVSDVTTPAVGEVASQCNDGGRYCTAAVNFQGLVVVGRLSGLPAETGDSVARQFVVLVAPEVIANLTMVVAPT